MQLPVYGIVTDGKLWEFGKLIDNVFTKKRDSYTVNELNKIFSILNFIFVEIYSAWEQTELL